MGKDYYFSLILSGPQEEFLSGSKYGIDRMRVLLSLIQKAATKEYCYRKKGFTLSVQVGQAVASEVELSHLWACNRKTVSRLIKALNDLQFIRTEKTNRTSIHTLLCVSGWFIEGHMIRNPSYLEMRDRE